MRIQLSDHFTYGKLLKFVLPSIVMMIFTSIYSVVDGLFVSNFVGKTPFAALNLIYPVLMMAGAIGFMIGTGGSAIVARTLGEGDRARANRYFSMLVYVTIAGGIAITVIGQLCMQKIAAGLGAEGRMAEYCVLYGRIVLLAVTAFMLQNVFQSFFIAAEKPKLGLYATVAAGIANMVLDALFVAVLGWGLEGAAAATALSQVVGGLIPLIYFARPNNSLLRLGRTEFDGRALVKVCTNGSSELLNNISMSLVNMLYNLQLLKYIGEDGVAAYGVLMYVSLVFQAVFIGYSVGTAPIVGYHYGAQNVLELKGLLKKSLALLGAFAAAMFGASFLLARPLSFVFTGYDEGLLALTVRAFSLFAFSFLFSGYVIFGSSFFTALNNGLISAAISFMRTLVFQVAAVLIFPLIWKVDGIWLSMVAAEVLALGVTAAFLRVEKKRYGY